MDFDITKVSIDGDVGDLSEEQLRELVSKFQDAQDSNVAEFEKAAEAFDDIDSSAIEDFAEARESLIEDITDAEAFDEVPLSEDALEDSDFSELQDWKDFVSEEVVEDDEDTEDTDFDDMGQKAPVDDDEEVADFVEQELNGIQGLNLD